MRVYRRYSYPPLKRLASVFYSLPGGGGLTLSPTDSVALSDAVYFYLSKPLSDTISLSDSYSKISAFLRTHSDSITLSDSIAIATSLLCSDTVSMSDNYSKVAAFVRTYSDTISLSDSMNIAAIYALLNFIAKDNSFNFTAKNNTFNFIAKG
jgi:hypothetical protein